MDDMSSALRKIEAAASGETRAIEIEGDFTNDEMRALFERIVQVPALETLSLGTNERFADGIIDDRLFSLGALRVLDLRVDVEQLPAGIERLQNLEVLRLGGYSAVPYPKEIYLLKNLRELAITIPQEHEGMPIEEEKGELHIGLLQRLETLDLDEANLYCLPRTIVQARGLRRLSLFNRTLSEKFPAGFETLPCLEEIDIRSTDNYRLLPDAVKQNPNIRILR